MAKKGKDAPATQTLTREGGKRVLSIEDYRLIVVEGPSKDGELDLSRDKLTVGSGKDNDLVIDDPAVSRKHCEFQKFGDRFLVRDLDSTNGTVLDGTAIREGFVKPGSVIEIGETTLKVTSRQQHFNIEPYAKDQFGELRGKSVRMRELFSILERVSPSDANILIQGETGTGKELVAKAIKQHSRRNEKPFITFDCSAVAPTLIESELFGHVKGAFTGAVGDRRGAFEAAHTGTIFLDEVGELTEDLQPKLLRALEQKEVRPVGSDKSQRVDVRLVAATNRDLAEEVKAGRFREDLFFRLSVIPVEIPSLRQRNEDIPLLVEAFLQEFAEKHGEKAKTVDKKAMEILMQHDWPGNVRELRNVIEGAVAMGAGKKLEPKDFIFFNREERRSSKDLAGSDLIGKSLEQVEKAVIEGTLNSHRGNKMATAKTLGIAYSTLYEKIKKYGIDS